ncbi:DUF1107 family protein [Ferrimonas pelagia]|uniref:DUF1107 family protein n=1 Tax=Ferrimonas pelagia TaxID=1177826 RepID=UPI0031EEA9DD
MRNFPLFAPKIIAKHARILRDGVVEVKDLGQLEFRNGRFLMPRHCGPNIRQAIVELNELLRPPVAPV